MTVRLHDYLPSGNGYKVRLLMTQLGIPFERIEYNITKGETRTPAFLENVNANGRIPVLETERLRLRAWRQEDRNGRFPAGIECDPVLPRRRHPVSTGRPV